MRTLRSNSWKRFWTGKYQGETAIYDTNENGDTKYITIDGESVPVEIGTAPAGYKITGYFDSNFSMSGGEAEAVQYGVDTSSYSAKIIMPATVLDIDETDLLWESEPETDENELADGTTAAYKIVKISPSKEYIAYLLDKIVE